MKKLFEVICYYDHTLENLDTFVVFVIAKDTKEAKNFVENEVWTLSGMKIKEIKEIDMNDSRILCMKDKEEED